MKQIPLAIRDFALPVPRTGSIEAHSGYGSAASEGQEIHLKTQQKRKQTDSNYQAEVKMSQTFERDGLQFQISGRMDGFFNHKVPKIEEIKSTFNLRELLFKLSESSLSHPYSLQLQTYGYFYWLEHKIIPQLSFYLVSTRSKEAEELNIELKLQDYELWLDRRLDELVAEAKQADQRTARRKKISEDFLFPFSSPRLGQESLIQTIQEGMKTRSPMLIQAPTGLGKTVGVLYPALKEAFSRGQNVVYVTPKNSQHSVAEDAVSRFRDTGAPIKSLTLTAKSKICFKNEPICNPSYCEYALDYYEKVAEHQLVNRVAAHDKMDSKVFRKLGEEYQVCPFELQMNALPHADTIICDYNYVFAPRGALREATHSPWGDSEGNPNLVIDEAHNLPSRSMDYYSPSLSSQVLEKMREEASDLPTRFRNDVEELLDDCIQAIIACRPDMNTASAKIQPTPDSFLEQDTKLKIFLSRYLDSDVEIQPRDVVLRLSFYWSEFTAALEFTTDPDRSEFFITFHRHPSGGIIKITCCDASKMLQSCYDNFDQVIAFSATLKPFEFYSKLSGLIQEKLKIAEFQSPFLKSNRKILIIPQISTKYSHRERNYLKISEAIQRIASLQAGNYFVFFPSFDFLERVLELTTPPEGFTLLRQEREMKAVHVEALLDYLKLPNTKSLIFAVQGGVLSEGMDYPGKMIIGAFIVGPPLPNFDLEREEMRKYYDKNYGSGFDYAYTYPAMAKAVQSAGRVIRSETDRGLIVLMDSRFIHPSYTGSMPSEWFDKNATELVSTKILEEVSQFWKQESNF